MALARAEEAIEKICDQRNIDEALVAGWETSPKLALSCMLCVK